MSRCGWCEDAPWRVECALCDPRRRLKLCVACAARWHARGVAQEHMVADITGVKRSYRDWARDVEDAPTRNEAPRRPDAEQEPGEQGQVARSHLADGDAGAGDALEAGAPSAPVVGEAASSTGEPVASSQLQTPSAASLELTSNSIVPTSSRSKAADLDALVKRFPTEDEDAHEALRALTVRAVREQDALLCAYFSKCDKPACAHALAIHQRHKKAGARSALGSESGEDEETQWALAFCLHLDECTNASCPFCIRVRLRVNVGSMQAMDQLLAKYRQELLHVADSLDSNAWNAAQVRFAVESRRNMLTLQSAKIERRREQLLEVSKRLDRLREQHALHGFVFPPFSWHLVDDATPENTSGTFPPEPSSLSGGNADGSAATTTDVDGGDPSLHAAAESEDAAATSSSVAAVDVGDVENATDAVAEAGDSVQESTDGAAPAVAQQGEAAAGADAAQPDGDAVYESDFIDKLLSAVKDASGGAEARRALDEALSLGCAIVDAGFCSSARASRCLLRCQTILTHLQHHVDLNVCSGVMCDAVEHHFAHLSQCRSRSSDVACEYCLRVREREMARSVEALEMEQPEADARVQSVINAMTDSLADDPPAEREQAIMQLEDELEQAEEEKRKLADKLSAERLELRRVRRRLDREGFFPSAGSALRLPPHFVKVLK